MQILSSSDEYTHIFLLSFAILLSNYKHIFLVLGDQQFGDVVGANALPNHIRREFLVQLKDVRSLLVGEWLPILSMGSGATIVIVSTPNTRPHKQACLELWGTPEAVDNANCAISNKISWGYPESVQHPYPSLLLLDVAILKRFVPLRQVGALFGILDMRVMHLVCCIGA
ncbi:uncharacterized protein LOC118490482 [Helianthus annuus]|uniref:uncharacterized protein LOC118490482 n=1 Tax=Helianthus annuus TaxID=4232 RepID=UPI001652DC77|nr:uncharacterized protein LOC118490482 [Helianthus annuus]